ncbi:aldehyde reductase [Flavobacterium sp. 316]|uniref:SDR family oxidoreductase n=1 Tax=Flavobacterium sp. 316 TaxID=1603293 RepID=UPI001F351FBD|nr:aldehyde reductase [Flavobacterium sp. 316]
MTGFLGSHTTIQLLNKGYQVKGTLRDKKRAESIREIIAKHTTNIDNLTFYEINLSDSEEKWTKAMTEIDYVIHIASPFPTTLPKNEDDIILPAKNGTLNILKSATKAKVKRVVLTSSTGAVVYGERKNGEFSEEDWTNIKNLNDTTPYFRSKTIAEKAAWDFVNANQNASELVTILPGAILGPILDKDDYGTSANLVKKMMDGSMPAMPKIGFEMADVRAVADAHIKALENPNASGKRYLCANGYMEFKDIAEILREEFPNDKIPSKTLPNFMVKLFSIFDKETKSILNDLGAKRTINNSKIKKELNWNPISLQVSVKDTAHSLKNLKIVK